MNIKPIGLTAINHIIKTDRAIRVEGSEIT